ncbi:hypothetical protein ACFFWC_19380 [Plantactinospora siamensis]|uniref:DUF4760 domain-containing protein n=1 Tax=Plantactinospora siamensis TaxID=555372 RepID=A0ABV6P3K6_9ACTN
MDMSQAINLLALLVALAAVVTSSLLTWRALRLNDNANHLPIVLDALKAQRTAEFTRMEAELWAELPRQDVPLGFAKLPEPLRGHAFEVGCYYQHLACLAEYGVADWDFIAVQVTYRMLRTWDCIRPYVNAERKNRGSDSSFLNSYERFAEKARRTDVDAATERLYRRGGRGGPALRAAPMLRRRRQPVTATE